MHDRPLQQPGWQVSGLKFARRCDGSRTRPLLYLRTRAGGALEKASSPSAIVPVITLRPALALLPPPAEPPRELGASAQRALADYVRAHTPFNYSAPLARACRARAAAFLRARQRAARR